jgi:hypothetical protein
MNDVARWGVVINDTQLPKKYVLGVEKLTEQQVWQISKSFCKKW